MTPKRIDRRVTDRLDKAEQRASAVPLKQNVSGNQVEVSLGGLRVEVTFTADGEQIVTLPAALSNVARHVEPMSLPDHGDKANPCGVRVRASRTAEWTHKQIVLCAKSDGLDDDPYPLVQVFRVY